MGWDEKEKVSRVRKEKEGKRKEGKRKEREEGNECCDSTTVSAPCECIEEQWVVH